MKCKFRKKIALDCDDESDFLLSTGRIISKEAPQTVPVIW
jgi:hypothetical protein